MWHRFTNRIETRYTGMALAALLSATLSLPAHAADIWKVNFAKSHFSSGSNTLVLEKDRGKTANQGVDAQGTPTASTLLVVSNGKIYLAMDEAAYNASSIKGIRTVGYTSWKGMKLVQIGDEVRSADHCGFRCVAGLPDPRMTLTFTANGVDPRAQMSNILVLNK